MISLKGNRNGSAQLDPRGVVRRQDERQKRIVSHFRNLQTIVAEFLQLLRSRHNGFRGLHDGAGAKHAVNFHLPVSSKP